jgi:glycine/D-amino acid oxidase-like deaminating enzyme
VDGILAQEEIVCQRYNDSPDGDWVIGKHPSDDSIILATAGSGHAYKVQIRFLLLNSLE